PSPALSRLSVRRRSAACSGRRTMTEPLLELRDLETGIAVRNGTVHALDGVSLRVMPGETLGVVGESGSGKTMTALSVMGLLPPGGRVSGGEILFEGRDLRSRPADEV